jgi:hypothetical protein
MVGGIGGREEGGMSIIGGVSQYSGQNEGLFWISGETVRRDDMKLVMEFGGAGWKN